MNSDMIYKWNSVVTPSDTVYHLGDFSWGNGEQIIAIFNALNGKKRLIFGNHDKKRGVLRSLFDECYDKPLHYDQYIFSHYPLKDNLQGKINCHGHIHNHPPERGAINVSVEVIDYTPIPLSNLHLLK